MIKQEFQIEGSFSLECGEELKNPLIVYHTSGQLNEARDNVVWVCHALTANSDAEDWWKGIVGSGCFFNPGEHFIVCANILGSCYGSTGPLSEDPDTGQPYLKNFPLITIRDMVRAHQLLARHLGIGKIACAAGGSMGGYQVLEWAVQEPHRFERLFLTVTAAMESPWGKAVHASQRLAIEADQSFRCAQPNGGVHGLKAARGIGMLTYRNFRAFELTQSDEIPTVDRHRAESYIRYQAEKLAKRFNAYTYWYLTKAMDSHHLERGRDLKLDQLLKQIDAKTLVVGVSSDILCPPSEQAFLAEKLPRARLEIIDSDFGHDGFLVELETMSELLQSYFG